MIPMMHPLSGRGPRTVAARDLAAASLSPVRHTVVVARARQTGRKLNCVLFYGHLSFLGRAGPFRPQHVLGLQDWNSLQAEIWFESCSFLF